MRRLDVDTIDLLCAQAFHEDGIAPLGDFGGPDEFSFPLTEYGCAEFAYVSYEAKKGCGTVKGFLPSGAGDEDNRDDEPYGGGVELDVQRRLLTHLIAEKVV